MELCEILLGLVASIRNFAQVFICLFLLSSVVGNPPSGGPKLTERHFHHKGSCYVTVGLLALRLGLECGLGTIT